MNKIKIGYQGIENSNNHRAALYFASKHFGSNWEILPLISGKNVVSALLSGKIDYGVYAKSTDVGGLVAENVEATKNVELDIIDSYDIHIQHNLFKKDECISNDSIKYIAGHPEAQKECMKTIKELYLDIQLILGRDSALAAKELSEGILCESTGVICSLKAGEQHKLTIIKEAIEDLEHNGTNFVLVRMKFSSGDNSKNKLDLTRNK